MGNILVLNHNTPNIFKPEYVTNVLGLESTLINESSSVEYKRLVINEYLILEGFWDDLKSIPGELGKIFKVLKQIITDERYVNKWIKALEDGVIKKSLDYVYNILDKLKLTNLKKILETNLNKIKSLGGWKTGFALTGFALLINFILKKLKKIIPNGIQNLTQKTINELISGFKDYLNNETFSVLLSLSGVGSFINWGKRLFKGINFIIDSLSGAVERFTKDKTTLALWKNENIEMNVVKKLLKESLHIESLLTELNDELDFSSFKMNDDLQPDIWDSEGHIKEDIRTNLIKIAQDYWESLYCEDVKCKNVPILDITLTGSLANYNWSKYSDVDLHIIFDINELGDNKEFIKDLLDVKTRKWNSDHDITIKGFEVELYLQPEDQPHHSTGVYSLTNDDWVLEPKKESVSLDKETIRKKYKEFVKQVNDIEKDKDNQSVINRIEKLKDKIKKMRKAGLETGGEYSVENIVFKLLRRNDIMEKLGNLSTDAYDDEYTIDEELL